jgi:hypothetical protein
MLVKQDIATQGLVKYALDNGGSIHPLIIDSNLTQGTGLMNPSVYVDDGKILINVRHINYALYHSEERKFPHQWGPLQYLHPEDDMALRTENFIMELYDDFSTKSVCKVEMTKNIDPVWHFVGLEDARLFKWDDKLYLCGVRRDHLDAQGKGRMDLSEIKFNGDTYVEVERTSLPAPAPNESYCEKNWMPILGRPNHWVKWSNPVEVVKYDFDLDQTITVHHNHVNYVPLPRDLRGGSQVMKWDSEHHIAITHEVSLYNDPLGRKDGTYLHRVVLWDKDWKIAKTTRDFTLMNGQIEFVTGMAFYQGNVLISFGFQDNVAYLLVVPEKIFSNFIMRYV